MERSETVMVCCFFVTSKTCKVDNLTC
jgi:hypothetical protein